LPPASRVPLQVGWNADEMNYRAIFRRRDPTLENFNTRARALCGDHAEVLPKVYPAETDA
jgi:hypothetical protein